MHVHVSSKTISFVIHTNTHSEHRRAVERLIEERRAQFQAQKEAELEERREEEKREAERRAIIEQERQRLLQEHAKKLLGYLPKVRTTCTCTLYFFLQPVQYVWTVKVTKVHSRSLVHAKKCFTCNFLISGPISKI